MRGWRPPDSGAAYTDSSFRTSPPATLSSPLPPLIPRVLHILMERAA